MHSGVNASHISIVQRSSVWGIVMSSLEPSPTQPRPEGARKWGKCLGCGQWHWLFEYEGGPNDLLCEGCIDEFHARVHDAEDRMAQGSDRESEEWAEEYYEEPDGEGYC